MFFILMVFFSTNVYAKNTWIVRDIKLEGLKHVAAKEVFRNLVFNIGSKISKNDIKNSILALFKTKKFENIRVISSSNILIFKLQERPLIQNIFITGNSMIQDTVLKKYLTQLEIDHGFFLNPFHIKIFKKNIRQFYHDHGKYACNIKILSIPHTDHTIDLKIIISEGSLTYLNKIKIFGNDHFSGDKIISLFELNHHNIWWNIFEKNFYSYKKLQQGLKKLKDFYLNQGYFYFKIKQHNIHFSKNKNKVDIIIDIFEGHQYKISRFLIHGSVFNHYNDILNIVNLHNDELYNQEKIYSIVNDIKKLLFQYGYIKSQVILSPQINHRDKTIILNFNIDLQKRYFVRKIYFSGNKITKNFVLQRKMQQSEGEYFNIKKVENGKKKLEKTGYFKHVNVMYNIFSDKLRQIDVIYQVEEQSTGSVNFGLGYGFDSGLSFNSIISQDNLFGSGNNLNTNVTVNKYQKYADLSIGYPYFFSKKTEFNTRIFYSNKKYHLDDEENIFKKTYGIESNLGFRINDTDIVNIGTGYAHNAIKKFYDQKNHTFLKSNTSNSDSLINDANKNNLLNDYTISYSWMHDSLKYLYFPIFGNRTYISAKHTIPGSDNHFYKIIFDKVKYTPLNKKKNFIFLYHVHMGIGHGFKKHRLPFYENFSINNFNNIRGFQSETIGPKTIFDDIISKNCIQKEDNQLCESNRSIGGNAVIISNFELITPIPLINKKYSQFLRSSFFIDVGNIWNTNINNIQDVDSSTFSMLHNLKNTYSSFGVSLQWFSPIGPLVFSYAHPIQKNHDRQLEPFQFNIGKNW
ncbi:MAG: outer membrane protein assembly factor BamA [Buchnera aphidicola (Pentalonia nigronervosa)]|uniref:Outer membrane protein assembly factor BamA n=1 Tax=Buchnera aphidicola (Pentalonia nigronervosa) TaxID=1309793 RepID=A0A7H1B032_9GAMM|nr:MAG: outer membrane protein assembly factor BamA [Buchnera aphidicola (Pentalonia nigronervosa)]